MRKVFFAINVKIDGFADHTAVIADDELHDFYAGLLDNADIVLFGRKTYELMVSFWPNAREDPRSTKSIIKFADKFNSISKVVFSRTLNEVNWNNTRLSKHSVIEEILRMKNQDGKNISVGSLSLASELTEKNLIDEYWFLVQPIILGEGKKLFEGLSQKTNLQLIDTRTFNSGTVVLHYQKI